MLRDTDQQHSTESPEIDPEKCLNDFGARHKSKTMEEDRPLQQRVLEWLEIDKQNNGHWPEPYTRIQQFHFSGYRARKVKTQIQKDKCTPVFMAALFTIVKSWKQAKYPSTGKWIKKAHMQWILLSHKKECNNVVGNNMDGPIDFHTKWNNSEIDKYHGISLTGGI